MPDALSTPEERLAYFVEVDKANRPLADNIPGGYLDAPLRRSDLQVVLATEEAALAVVGRLQAQLDRVRSLRLARPSAAVDPAVHTPQRVRAYLAAGGWEVAEGGRVAELWRLVALPDRQLLVPLIPTAPDYAKVLGALATDLAERCSVGELGILADIAASGTEVDDA